MAKRKRSPKEAPDAAPGAKFTCGIDVDGKFVQLDDLPDDDPRLLQIQQNVVEFVVDLIEHDRERMFEELRRQIEQFGAIVDSLLADIERHLANRATDHRWLYDSGPQGAD
jgi:hypothetical protein